MARKLPAGVSELPNGTYKVRRMVAGKRIDRRARDYDAAMIIYRELYGSKAATRVEHRLSLERWLYRYLTTRDDLAPSSKRTYESLIRNYIHGTAFASRPIEELDDDAVRDFLRSLAGQVGTRTGRTLSPTTVRQVRKLLTGALGDAETRGKITRNPVRGVKLAKAPKAKITPPTAAEMATIATALAGHRYAPILAVARLTGCRIGEILALRWQDVRLDGERPYLEITGTLDHTTKLRRDIPKTDASYRRLRIPTRSLVMALRNVQALQISERERAGRRWHDRDGLVFTTPTGNAQDAHNLLRVLQRVAEQTGVEAQRHDRGAVDPLHVHDYRHAYATIALEAGVPIELVAKLLGHSSIRVTADTYGHVTDRMTDDAADAIAVALG
jgi:integrase